MCEAPSEPFAIQETYADGLRCEVKNGNLFVTFYREIDEMKIAVSRVIMSLECVPQMRAETARALMGTPAASENVIKLVAG